MLNTCIASCFAEDDFEEDELDEREMRFMSLFNRLMCTAKYKMLSSDEWQAVEDHDFTVRWHACMLAACGVDKLAAMCQRAYYYAKVAPSCSYYHGLPHPDKQFKGLLLLADVCQNSSKFGQSCLDAQTGQMSLYCIVGVLVRLWGPKSLI